MTIGDGIAMAAMVLGPCGVLGWRLWLNYRLIVDATERKDSR